MKPKELIYKFIGAVVCALGFFEMPLAHIVTEIHPPFNFEKGSLQGMGFFLLVTMISILVAVGIVSVGIKIYGLGNKK